MSAQEIKSNVENIEAEAEKIMETARSRANEIVLKARDEAAKILSAALPLGDAEKERQRIIEKAREQANKEIEAARIKANELKGDTSKMAELTQRIINIVTGAEVK